MGTEWAAQNALKENSASLDLPVDADDVILSPDAARRRGLTPTICFPVGNLAPERKRYQEHIRIDPSLIDENNVYRHNGPARVFITEAAAIDAIKRGAVSHGRM